jgi:GMP synthase (glutamine-hydrolysing)
MHHGHTAMFGTNGMLSILFPQYIKPFKEQPIPKEMGEAVGLVIMGGPMGVYEQDQFPFLSDEIRLIERTLKENKPILGICLGSQLIASALGAEIKKGNHYASLL